MCRVLHLGIFSSLNQIENTKVGMLGTRKLDTPIKSTTQMQAIDSATDIKRVGR